jgi:RNA polymerase sigma-70 factor, ECF subfamily
VRVASPSFEPNVAEHALIQRVLGGDAECFYELVKPYERGIFYAALSILNNDADAEETCQEAILKAFKNLSYFRMEAKFSTWLTQIVINEARLRLRKDRRHMYESIDEGPPDDEGDYVPRDFADWRDIPSECLEKNQLREALKKALASLKPKYREVFILRDIQQMNIADTAKTLGISEASVKTRLLRARLMMRDALAPGFDGSWAQGKDYSKVRPW